MAAGVPARLTPAQGRRFGLTVGGAFLVFAAIAWWRGHPTTTTVLGTLGGVLSIAGLIIPGYLGPVESAWMKLAHLISKVTTPIVMGVMYLLVLTPIGLLKRSFTGNAMVHTPHGESYWKSRPAGKRAGELTRQF
jgi:amino acid transporter